MLKWNGTVICVDHMARLFVQITNPFYKKRNNLSKKKNYTSELFGIGNGSRKEHIMSDVRQQDNGLFPDYTSLCKKLTNKLKHLFEKYSINCLWTILLTFKIRRFKKFCKILHSLKKLFSGYPFYSIKNLCRACSESRQKSPSRPRAWFQIHGITLNVKSRWS